jgi:hypothetical protein
LVEKEDEEDEEDAGEEKEDEEEEEDMVEEEEEEDCSNEVKDDGSPWRKVNTPRHISTVSVRVTLRFTTRRARN